MKAVLIGVVLVSVNQLSGLSVFLIYTAEIFNQANSAFTPNTSTIIVGALQFAGSLLSLTLIDKFSRKFLYSATAIGQTIGLLAIGLHNYFETIIDVSRFKFIPVASFSLVLSAAAIGRLPLTFMIMAEIMPSKTRSFGVSISTTFNWILDFLALRYFSMLVDLLQFHTCMFIFSGFSIFGTIFVIFFVPETKSKSFDEIANLLTRRKFEYTATRTEENAQIEDHL
jgi:MFS family permease